MGLSITSASLDSRRLTAKELHYEALAGFLVPLFGGESEVMDNPKYIFIVRGVRLQPDMTIPMKINIMLNNSLSNNIILKRNN